MSKRYSREFDDYDPMNASTKSRDEMDKFDLTMKNIRADSGDVEILTELEWNVCRMNTEWNRKTENKLPQKHFYVGILKK